jgi:hypothetical protein
LPVPEHQADIDRFAGRVFVSCFPAINSNGQTIWIADAHRGDGKRFVVRADERLTGFVELEEAIHTGSEA